MLEGRTVWCCSDCDHEYYTKSEADDCCTQRSPAGQLRAALEASQAETARLRERVTLLEGLLWRAGDFANGCWFEYGNVNDPLLEEIAAALPGWADD